MADAHSRTPPHDNNAISVINKSSRNLKDIICSFEFVFLLFIFAGVYNHADYFSGIPVHLSLFFGVGTMFIGASIFLLDLSYLKLSPVQKLCLGLFGALVSWTAFSLLMTPATDIGQTKVFRLATISAWSFVGAGLIISQRRKRFQRVLAGLGIIALWFAIESIGLYITSATATAVPFNTQYLNLGYPLAIGVLVFAYYMLESQVRWRFFLSSIGFGLCNVALFIGGARGPILGLVVGFPILFISKLKYVHSGVLKISRPALSFTAIGISVLTGLIALAQFQFQLRSLTRIIVAFTAEGGGSSIRYRVLFYKEAYEQFLASPIFGHGVGSFAALYHGVREPRIPHNIFLELGAELGLVGVLVFALFVVFPVIRALRVFLRSWSADVALLLAIFALLSTRMMVGGGLGSQRSFFFTVGLLLFSGYAISGDTPETYSDSS